MYAYCTLVMHNPAYLCGALVLFDSLRRHGTKADLVLMVTADVAESESMGRARAVLTATEGGPVSMRATIVTVPLITAQAIQAQSKRFAHMYGWIDHCFTKYNALGLTQYDKVVFLDADMFAVGPLRDPTSESDNDTLFGLAAPAGICSTVPAEEQDAQHGRLLADDVVRSAIDTDYGIRGCLLVLEPNQADLDAIKTLLQRRGSYGATDRHIGPDERLISEFYASDDAPAKRQWTHVHARFGSNSWGSNTFEPVLVHFVSEKPWSYKTYWDDFKLWEDAARSLCAAHPDLRPLFDQHAPKLFSRASQVGRGSSSSNQGARGDDDRDWRRRDPERWDREKDRDRDRNRERDRDSRDRRSQPRYDDRDRQEDRRQGRHEQDRERKRY